MFPTRLMAICLAVLLQACAGKPPTGIGTTCAAAADPAGAAGGWSVWTEARVIPDADRRGTLIGPVVTDEGADLGRVILRLDICHPATGDLDVRLAYDADGDGSPEASTPVEFFRSRSDPGAQALHACPMSLDGSYFFRDSADEEEQIFAKFQSLPPGRAFYLVVADTLAEDTGVVLRWAIHTGESQGVAAN